MRDLSLHLMDLAQNSITAGAGLIEIALWLTGDGFLGFSVKDDGCGMDEETLQKALDPFGTTRTTRKVGLGIPLTRAHALQTGGEFTLNSGKGTGTGLTATFDTGHIDCPPPGNFAETILTLLLSNPDTPDFAVTFKGQNGEETLDTRQIKASLPVPLTHPDVMSRLFTIIPDMVNQTLGGIKG